MLTKSIRILQENSRGITNSRMNSATVTSKRNEALGKLTCPLFILPNPNKYKVNNSPSPARLTSGLFKPVLSIPNTRGPLANSSTITPCITTLSSNKHFHFTRKNVTKYLLYSQKIFIEFKSHIYCYNKLLLSTQGFLSYFGIIN